MVPTGIGDVVMAAVRQHVDSLAPRLHVPKGVHHVATSYSARGKCSLQLSVALQAPGVNSCPRARYSTYPGAHTFPDSVHV
jgi:hypothetical protein